MSNPNQFAAFNYGVHVEGTYISIFEHGADTFESYSTNKSTDVSLYLTKDSLLDLYNALHKWNHENSSI